MLTIIIPETEYYDEIKNEFKVYKEQKLQLEHSLVSISKWESKFHKPFLGKDNKIKQTYAIDKDWKSGLYTHYKILIPLYPRKNRRRQSESEKNNERMDKNPLQSLFDDTILDKKPTEEIVYYIPGSVFFAKEKELNDLFPNCYKSQRDKMECVKNIEATFEKKIGGNITENKVVAIGLEDYARIQIELFAKGLFSFFSQTKIFAPKHFKYLATILPTLPYPMIPIVFP